METKKRIEWLSEGLDGFIFPIVKEVLTYKQGEELCAKSEALSGIISTLKVKFDSQDWDRINAEKFNNKVQLKMEDWGVAFDPITYKISFRNSFRFYTELSNGKKLNNIYIDNDINKRNGVISFDFSDFDALLSLFRPELERVTNEFNNR